ncbi:MAG: transglutaminase domain-containing protein, partial [Acidobacteriota bacterium]
MIENFAEAFFKAKIKEQPEQLENYALLAKAYLRNDKASEGELVLRDAIKRLPQCVLFQTLLLDAFSRGEKNDEIPTTHELIYSLDKNVPETLEYRIDDFLEKSEFDKAEELIKAYEKLRPDSEVALELRMDFYSKKDQEEKIKEVLQKALRLYPTSWRFVYADALLSVETTGKHARAIAAMEKYLAKNYTYTTLATLAGFHLQASDTKKWLETYNKVLELNPASTHSYFQIAEVYFKRQDYTQAEKMVRKALALCPGASAYWSKLGEIHRVRKETELAKQAYREALKFNPLDYDARRLLRELEGKPSIFSLFESADIKKLIAQAPDTKAYPESGGVILLQETKRVVYQEGASESSIEVLIKVFNKRGIDDFKEYWIGLNGYTQTLVVEKAVVVKPNGNEISADIQSNHVVFKTLEENDTIYLKWNIKNYNSGKLFSDFWDSAHFNSFYPNKLVRYSLLVPPEFKFQASAQNMSAEATKKQTDAGIIHQWAVQDEPAIEIEVGMPVVEDVGKILYVSSISGWDSLVSWYADLSRSKTRNTWEIKEQVEKLIGGKKEMTNEEKVEAIYNFITENIRYSSVSFRQSGLIPQKARDVLVNKIGDCKDVATLCITMLREAGVTSHYVLLNTRNAGQYRNALPAILFNHCIVAVETKNGLRYLDLTAHNLPADSLPELDREAFSLLIKPDIKNAALLPVDKLAPRQVIHRTNVEVKEDMAAQIQYNSDWQGAAAAYPRMIFRYKGPNEREKMLNDAVGAVFPGAKLTGLEFGGLDAPKSTSSISYRVSVPSYLSEAGQFKLLKLHWSDRI